MNGADGTAGATGVPAGAPTARWLLRAALLLLLATLAAISIFNYSEVRRSEGRVREQADRIEHLAERVAEQGATLASLRTAEEQAGRSLQALQEQADETRDSVVALARWRQQSSLDWTLAESEHLLILAAQELALTRDIPTALAAMQAADLRLAGLGDPDIGTLRAQLASDMEALRSVPQPDRDELTRQLSVMIGGIEGLPLRQEQRPDTDAAPAQSAPIVYESSWRKFWQAVRAELGRLVVVTRRDQAPVLLPEERYFVAMNLRLQLEGARFALQRRDTVAFRAAISDAQGWLERYFDTGSPTVTSLQSQLLRMAGLDLDPTLPAIDSSLESLRAIIRRQSLSTPPALPESAP